MRAHVEANLTGEVSLTTAADVAGLSAKYFSAFFRRHTGTCYTDWVAAIRIDRVKRLLRESNQPIARIAFAVGFRDLRTFQRAFKKQTGITPAAFKKSVAPKSDA